MAAVLEDPPSQLPKLAGTSEPDQEVSREIDHFDSTEVGPGEKRRLVGEDGSQNKKLCLQIRPEDQTENGEERNETDSSLFVNSNGPSTSTKPASIPQSVTADGAKDPVKEKNSIVGEDSEPAGAKEKVKDSGEEPEKEGEIDETTSKLLASGISISLIKKKKSQTEEVIKVSEPGTGELRKSNPLEVGPHISVTMVRPAVRSSLSV